MTQKVTLDVISPASSAPSWSGGAPVVMTDHLSAHSAIASDNPHMPDIMRYKTIGDAHILALGVKVGDKIMGCTYITEVCPIPGLGNIRVEQIGRAPGM